MPISAKCCVSLNTLSFLTSCSFYRSPAFCVLHIMCSDKVLFVCSLDNLQSSTANIHFQVLLPSKLCFAYCYFTWTVWPSLCRMMYVESLTLEGCFHILLKGRKVDVTMSLEANCCPVCIRQRCDLCKIERQDPPKHDLKINAQYICVFIWFWVLCF